MRIYPLLTEEALTAAKDWLNLMDAGRFDEAWEATTPEFKTTLGSLGWNALMNRRSAVLPIVRRSLRQTKMTNELPGMPDGNYIVIQAFVSSEVAGREGVVETVTVREVADGQWRICGYHVTEP
jgi:hypothetical protein